jgi:hypothetical protein
MSDWPEDEPADWWQQQDNEARRWAEEPEWFRHRQLLLDSRREQIDFEREMNELNEHIRRMTI